MRWTGGRRSGNIQDRRGMGGMVAGGGIGAVVIALIAMFFGVDPGAVVQQTGPAGPQPQVQAGSPTDSAGTFVDLVLGSTQTTWTEIFRQEGAQYRPPELVLFDGLTPSACGTGQAAMGPFYCPLDRQVYIDLSFFEDMRTQLGAGGDFAQAYVIAHEVGHHVQTLTGVSEQVRRMSARAGQAEANSLSVRQELQADCYAGLWAHHARGRDFEFEEGDVEEALNTASAIGDDRLQQESQGRVVPESFTHGTSEQRVRWFRRGLETGDVNACDTFSASQI